MPEKLQVLYCFTKYKLNGPSSRYRTYQYIDIFKKHYKVYVHAGFGNWYLESETGSVSKAWWLLKAFIYRCWKVLTLPSDCIVWIEYELFPYMPPMAEWYLKWRKIPFAVDYDDAIFHNYDQSVLWLIRKLLSNKIAVVMRLAKTVVTGSPYLTNYALLYNPNTVEIPTSIDIEKYENNKELLPGKSKDVFVAGWLGSKATSSNVLMLKEALPGLRTKINVELWLMGFDMKMAHELEGLPVKFFKWEANKEVAFLNTIDLGLMPLYDKPFNRGKCGFKLIQYMAAGKPTLSTPLEANVKINRNGRNAHASNTDEWYEGMLYFSGNKASNADIGKENQEIVRKYYSKKANANKLLEVIDELVMQKTING